MSVRSGDLPAATAFNEADTILINQDGVTKKAPLNVFPARIKYSQKLSTTSVTGTGTAAVAVWSGTIAGSSGWNFLAQAYGSGASYLLDTVDQTGDVVTVKFKKLANPLIALLGLNLLAFDSAPGTVQFVLIAFPSV